MKTLNRLFLLTFLTLSFVSTSFAQNKTSQTEIWKQDDNIYIKLAPTESSARNKNAHPVELETSTLLLALESIYIKKSRRNYLPLFSEAQQITLATYLATGLKQAKNNQDVVFVLEKEKVLLGGLKRDKVFVSGRAFYSEGQLNIIIGEYDKGRNRAYEMAYDPTNQGLITYDFDYGSRNKKSNVKYGPVEFSSDSIHFAQNGRDDWIAFDIDSLTTEEAQLAEQPKFQPQPSIDRPSNLPARQTQPPSPRAQPVQTPPKISEDSDLISRFVTLEELKKKGLISDEEYEKKRKELLSEL